MTIGEAPGELREDIPLKPGTKTNPLCPCNEDFFVEWKFINVAFGVLTVVITVALLVQIYYGDYQVVPHGSVATDSRECSEIGTSALKLGGNAIDAAVSAAFCLAVVHPHSTGLDAGGLMMLYDHKTRIKAQVIDFNYNTSQSLPKLVLGLFDVHRAHGRLSWKDVVTPAANLAKKGFLISKQLALQITKMKINSYGSLQPGQKLELPILGNTLQTVASSTKELVKASELNKPLQTLALRTTFNDYNLYVPNSPNMGPELLLSLQSVRKFNFTNEDVGRSDYIYKVVQSTRSFYDNKLHGTSSNVAVIDLNDIYVSLTIGLNAPFGSQEMTSDGYILDMNDANSYTRLPFILIDGRFICGKRMILGSNDLTTATHLITALTLSNENASSVIESPRFMVINGSVGIESDHEPFFDDEVLLQLEKLTTVVDMIEPYDSCNIVEKKFDDLNSHSDSRGGGIASRF